MTCSACRSCSRRRSRTRRPPGTARRPGTRRERPPATAGAGGGTWTTGGACSPSGTPGTCSARRAFTLPASPAGGPGRGGSRRLPRPGRAPPRRGRAGHGAGRGGPARPGRAVGGRPRADERRLRRLVIAIAPDADPAAFAWAWSQGGTAIPPLARYLLHAAKLRYQLRVWQRDGQARQVRGALDAVSRELREPRRQRRRAGLGAAAEARGGPAAPRGPAGPAPWRGDRRREHGPLAGHAGAARGRRPVR